MVIIKNNKTYNVEILNNTTYNLQSKYETPNYFYVEDASGSSNTLSIKKNNANAPTITVYKSTDQTTWESMGNTSTTAITATVPANGKLYLKATANTWAVDFTQYNYINCSSIFNVGGNIMSLVYGDNYHNKTTFTSNWALCTLFYESRVKNATELLLPATTLTGNCYDDMFYGCTSLITAPELPATTLATSCYFYMFFGCTSLTVAPALPATTLAGHCYFGMFEGCTSLNTVTTYANDISADNCLASWLDGVSATGDFYNLGGATYPSGANGIPVNWTEHNTL